MCHLVQLSEIKEPEEQALCPSPITKLLSDSLFAEPQGLPPRREFDHKITLLPGSRRVNLRPYCYNPEQKDEIEKQIAEMLRQGIIRFSTSPFASPVLLVQKKDGTWRFCIDFRYLNALTLKNRYPLPIIDELLDELSGAAWFTSLDLRSGYHHIRMAEGEEHKTAFQTHQGHYEFRVMPYGLTGAPATFQNAMNTIFAPLLRKCVLVFIDDILIYSPTLEQHQVDLKAVLELLAQHQLKVKRSKCTFAQPQLKYLGHIISANGVATDSKSIEAVRSWPVPQNAKEVRKFLGLAGYYRKFVRNFGLISRILTDLLKKNELFVWTPDHQQAFLALKQALLTAPVLAFPNFDRPFVVETDASDCGIGAVLMQDQHPIAFLSRALGPRLRGLSTYEKESLAILLVVDRWRPYLQQSPFVIRTDQRALSHLDEQRLTTPWQQKALTKLLGLQYSIVYKKGSSNQVADALSRHPAITVGEVLAITMGTPEWLQEIRAGYTTDAVTQHMLTLLKKPDSKMKHLVWDGGDILHYKQRIWVGGRVSMQNKIL